MGFFRRLRSKFEQTQIFTCKTYINSWEKKWNQKTSSKVCLALVSLRLKYVSVLFSFALLFLPFFASSQHILCCFSCLGEICMRIALKAHWMWQKCECNDKFKAFLCNWNSFKSHTHSTNEKKNFKHRFAYYLFQVDQNAGVSHRNIRIMEQCVENCRFIFMFKVVKMQLLAFLQWFCKSNKNQLLVQLTLLLLNECAHRVCAVCNSIESPFCCLPNYWQFQRRTWTRYANKIELFSNHFFLYLQNFFLAKHANVCCVDGLQVRAQTTSALTHSNHRNFRHIQTMNVGPLTKISLGLSKSFRNFSLKTPKKKKKKFLKCMKCTQKWNFSFLAKKKKYLKSKRILPATSLL